MIKILSKIGIGGRELLQPEKGHLQKYPHHSSHERLHTSPLRKGARMSTLITPVQQHLLDRHPGQWDGMWCLCSMGWSWVTHRKETNKINGNYRTMLEILKTYPNRDI